MRAKLLKKAIDMKYMKFLASVLTALCLVANAALADTTPAAQPQKLSLKAFKDGADCIFLGIKCEDGEVLLLNNSALISGYTIKLKLIALNGAETLFELPVHPIKTPVYAPFFLSEDSYIEVPLNELTAEFFEALAAQEVNLANLKSAVLIIEFTDIAKTKDGLKKIYVTEALEVDVKTLFEKFCKFTDANSA